MALPSSSSQNIRYRQRVFVELEPAASVIALLGGHTKVAEICGLHRTAVYRWAYPKSRRGLGGRIPQDNHRLILRAAREQGIAEITAESLLDWDTTPQPDNTG